MEIVKIALKIVKFANQKVFAKDAIQDQCYKQILVQIHANKATLIKTKFVYNVSIIAKNVTLKVIVKNVKMIWN